MDAEELFGPQFSTLFTQYPDLSDRPVFIVGGSSGIGAYLVAGFAAQGARVGFLSNEPECAKILCDKVEVQVGKRPFYANVDVRNLEQLNDAIAQFSSQMGEVSVLINNTARDDRHSLEEMTETLWQYIHDTNLRSYAFAIKAVLPSMIKKGFGNVVNMGSNASQLGVAGFPAYVSSKAAIVGLSKSLAREYGAFGVRVNTLSPGWVLTERQRQLWYSPKNHRRIIDQQSIKRMVNGVDVVNTALFLSSRASAMITGQEIVVDGGRA